ncbi:MAG: copper amine oxidase N-terminal domain-containing protein, partial [Armatimonadetes bacterium]|nr:copper amine oxidase N-terminal domain-containing protein [Armatimonadota bacterium]
GASAYRRMHGSVAALISDRPADRIGAQSRYSIDTQTAILTFVSGRVFVIMNLGGINRREPGARKATIRSEMDAHLEEVARTLARGLEWVIRQHPDMMAEGAEGEQRMVMAGDKPISAPALTFGSVAWASLDTFRQAGAKVAWDARSGKATVSYGGKTVELTALRRQARVNGVRFNLPGGVMVDRFGPIVPLRKVAEALGMKVRATKTTIEVG